MEEDLNQKKTELKDKIQTLEWDKKRNQIHAAKRQKLKKYKEELEVIEAKLNGTFKEPEEKKEEAEA